MKKLFFIFLLLQYVCGFSQHEKLVNLLNKELKKELKRIKENPDAEKFEVVQFFKLSDSVVIAEEYVEDPQSPRKIMRADLKILSVEVRKKDHYTGKPYIERQEVSLGKIEELVKDINILFTTEENAVLVTTIEEDGTKELRRTDLFFLHLNQEKNNEHLADEIVSVFNNSGYYIKKEIWAD